MAEFPFEISPMFEGERVRKEGMFVELGGPKSLGLELVRAKPMDEIEDDKVTIVGPDLKDMEEGKTYPWAMIFNVGGELVEPDLESVIERRVHDFINYCQGIMHLNQRYDVWMRISKDTAAKLDSLEPFGKAVMMLFKTELPFIEKMQVTFYTDQAEVEKQMTEAKEIFKARDARTKDLHDEDVDVFYGCTLCQSFAPTNVCVVSPDRVSLCGAINWFDGRAAAKVDPEGPQFSIDKGELLDANTGEYSGVNEVAKKLSSGEYEKVKLHSFFDAPHTSCGCFEVVGFYIPEVDGIGWVNREYQGMAPNGLGFSTMAGQTGGGKQIVGFLGIGVNYFYSPKFIQADGGWNRVVWLPSMLKENIDEAIPEDIKDKIATEKDATDIESLKAFLQEKNHPVVANWAAAEEEEEEEEEGEEEVAVEAAPMMMPAAGFQMPAMPAMPMMSGGASGIKLTFKNAKITIDRMIISEKKEKK
ncbi:MAG: CO dehydrogenase/CO-methylating acetyl-CoA synthase complex subunit beta [Methanosarcina flavescens]|jgi:acetyl-CoA decarbonylase/synthase complex subunit beta|uniref:Acetyl-CoA decarbonylase/synthase complex subunit beta n=1 Tax=Methanosarcina flavescens TaxID=1715806 RepID=A0A660HQ47_9EURY|nr:CO dehydrogenase/CO-methylating acetyl-CoA synthase complex subunit beta [Methanosarcina flavescens]AYK14421.1 CO dehydrogenase/CO-methylating acetyl-CoA synthase complex subunit beta [Methanosarcina flavescens]NLK32593.1 CO dehydrogenase/CO-methylating acetyl-CoA synthase complex subunit beta [Methanosarcina flavescens]